MLAAVFEGVNKGIKLRKIAVPRIERGDDILIEVKACGLCGTDIAILEGRHPSSVPVVLGHEYTGVVKEIGDDIKSVNLGDHVVIDPNIKCGKCRYCRRKKENLCENMTTLGIFADGGLARYNLAPEKSVYRIPEGLVWKEATLVEPVSCVLNGIQRAHVFANDVVIIGAGPIGLIWIATAKRFGASKIIVSEPIKERREAARRIGADEVLDPSQIEIARVIKDSTEGGADVVVDAVGSSDTSQQAVEMVGRGGRVVFFGTSPKSGLVRINPYDVMRQEKEILGSYIANFTFQSAIETVRRAGLSNILYTHEFEISEISKAIEIQRKRQCIKILIRP